MRRNVNSLDPGHRERLRNAMRALIGNGTRYQDIGNYHGGPMTICIGKSCCPHGDNTFNPWHRLYMAHMEDELGEALPYWDWTEHGEIPDLWEEIKAPIKDGESSWSCELDECSSDGKGGKYVSRDNTVRGIDTAEQKKSVRDAMILKDFNNFGQTISNGAHGSLHVNMKCDMVCTTTAGYDTVFYLHHTYVDYLWAFWQEVQRLDGNSVNPNFHHPLEPFDRQGFNHNSKTLRNSRPQDTFDYKERFCYEYDQLLFDNLTPAEFVYWNKNRKDCNPKPAEGKCGPSPCCLNLPSGKIHCEVICSCSGNEGNEALCKFSVGVVLPKSAPTGNNNFELCRFGSCVPGGTVGTFGGTTARSSNDYAGFDDQNYFLRDTDVTDVISEQGWSLDDPITVRMTESVVGNLPEPVVIIKKLSEDGNMDNDKATITLNPKASPARYGNLIKGYAMNKNNYNDNNKMNDVFSDPKVLFMK